ncbi:MAG: sialidase family protein, partial [Candidatus Thorarchaeota archaeon]
MGKLHLFSIMCIAMLIMTAIPSITNENQFVEAQDVVPQIESFSENVLLSTRDLPYAHHVEPTLAISDNGTIFAGWKNSETDYGGGARVSVVKSVDGGTTWTDPHNMQMFNGLSTRQSDPWLVWHD